MKTLLLILLLVVILLDFKKFYNNNQHKNYRDKIKDEYFWIVYFAFEGKDGHTYNNSVEYTGELGYIDFRKEFIQDLKDAYDIVEDDILELVIEDGFESGPNKPKNITKIMYNYYIVKKNNIYKFLKNNK